MFSVAGIFDGVSDGIALRGKYFRVLKQWLMTLGNNRVGVSVPAMPVILHGIKNCDAMKKARAWLDVRGVA